MSSSSICLRRVALRAALFATAFVGNAAFAVVTVPITAASFPKEVISAEAGKIEFWAKLSGVSDYITVGGYDPYFFQIVAPSGPYHSVYHLGFNANDGSGNSGLTGIANSTYMGTGGASYADVLGAGQVAEWHKYLFQWNKDGILGVADGHQTVAIFVDGALKSSSWYQRPPGDFAPLSGGTLNLITTGGPAHGSPGQVAIDELKIYDGSDQLILWNTLGSADEIAHSAVGLDGAFNGGGGAYFVQGISGNALMATPVGGLGDAPPPPMPEPASLVMMTLGAIFLVGWRRVARRAVVANHMARSPVQRRECRAHQLALDNDTRPCSTTSSSALARPAACSPRA